ncbi:hypothetical protein PILCRDRAFT_811303 [Piloderma croceum F 1598]|uniref:MARVEL domain-containing protein n=1 Tax=Piloderma croceum (strain F 1598) TaxID=765440 RepID=A0A0C3GGN6_PILCF|nr:hypothetical protein PILCRDRAFT_811303 [Piloderma croceum F 1598]
MALAASSLTIVAFVLLFQWSQPRIEVFVLSVLGILWLAVASFSVDLIGHIECFPLGNQQTASNKGTTSARAYCYEMKVVEGFSWAISILFSMFSVLVVALTSRSVAMGNRYAWSDPIIDLPWFGEIPGYYQAPHYGYGGQQMYLPPPGAIQQQPGHSVVIQPGHHGQPTTVQQIPTM